MKQIIHSLVNKDSKRIEMPPWAGGEVGWGNLAHPNPFVLNTSVAEYPMGTKFVDGTRTWIYSHFRGVTLTQAQTSVVDEDCATHMFGKGLLGYAYLKNYTATYVRSLAASDEIILGVTDTDTHAGTPASDHYYAGGWIMTYDSVAGDNKINSYRIVESGYSDSAVTIAGTSMATPTTLLVDHDTPVALTATAIATVMPNQWKHLVYNPSQAADTMCPVLGASCVGNITGAGYLWVQTYGEIGIGHWSADIPGNEEGQVDTVWMSDGSMNPKEQKSDHQKAGFIVANPKSMDGTPTEEHYPIVFLTMIR